jgi:hypothetical protein
MKKILLVLWAISPLLGIAQRRMGCKLDSNAYEKVFLSKLPQRGEHLQIPKQFSLKKYCPTPKNQGDYGTCVAWTSAYYARTIMLAQKHQWNNQKEIDYYAGSPYFLYEHIKSYTDKNCQEGAGLIIALEALKQYGTVPLHQFSKNCGQIVTEELKTQTDFYRIGEYRRLFLANSKDKTTPVKRSISQGKPVVIGLQCFFKSFIQAKDSVWKPQEKELEANWRDEGGHALTLVGYNDDIQAFEAVNSWGNSWANKGFIWIPYHYFNEVCFEAYEMYEPEEPAAQIAGEIRLNLSVGVEMPLRLKEGFYETTQSYQVGTLFKMYISNAEPVFVYAFSTDLINKNLLIFPEEQKSPLLYQSAQMALPDENHYIQLESNSPTDYLCILYCKERLHLPSLISQLNETSGSFPDRLQKVLGSKLIPSQQVTFQEISSIKFTAKTGKGSILPVIVAIKKKN